MRSHHLAILAFSILSACTLPDDDPFNKRMTMDSETCRSMSATELSQRGVVNGESTQTRADLYDKSYRSCMAAKGYDFSPTATGS